MVIRASGGETELADRLRTLAPQETYQRCLRAARDFPEFTARVVTGTRRAESEGTTASTVGGRDEVSDAIIEVFGQPVEDSDPFGPLVLLDCPWPGCAKLTVWDDSELREIHMSGFDRGPGADGFCLDHVGEEEARRHTDVELDRWASMSDDEREQEIMAEHASEAGAALLALASGDYRSMDEYDELLRRI